MPETTHANFDPNRRSKVKDLHLHLSLRYCGTKNWAECNNCNWQTWLPARNESDIHGGIARLPGAPLPPIQAGPILHSAICDFQAFQQHRKELNLCILATHRLSQWVS